MKRVLKLMYLNVFSIFGLMFFVPEMVSGQRVFPGLAAVYNLQTGGFAGDIRAELAWKKISLVPQINYYPGFNQVHELFFSLSLHYHPYIIGNFVPYALVNAGYNHWLNPETSPMPEQGSSHYALEAGIGLSLNKPTRPFAEWRYNIRWQEATVRVGLYFGIGKKLRTCHSYI